MSKAITKERARLLAAEYVANGFNRAAAMLACGYSDHYTQAKSGAVFASPMVKAEVNKVLLAAESAAVVKVCQIQAEHRRLAEIAEKKGDLATATRNIELLGKTIGAYCERLIATTDNTPLLTAEERQLFMQLGKQYIQVLNNKCNTVTTTTHNLTTPATAEQQQQQPLLPSALSTSEADLTSDASSFVGGVYEKNA